MDEPGKAYEPALRLAFDAGIQFLQDVAQNSVSTTISAGELKRRLSHELSNRGIPPEQVIQDLVADTAGGILGSRGGRFFGWVIGGATPAAQAADLLTSMWDQNAALHATGPAAAIIEEVCGQWLKELLDLPESASFALVTGCQMSHFTCLAAARHFVLAKAGWNVESRGLAGAPGIRVLTGNHIHGSTVRAIRFLGLGTDSIVDVDTDNDGRMFPSALAAALVAGKDHPKIVILQAGDINLGAFDPFDALIPLAHQHGAWVHVDGAFGLWAAASPGFRHLLHGANQADSWSTDGHKWLNVPYDCGYAFVRNRAAHRSAMSMRASYLTHDEKFRDQMDWNPEWSRRSRGIATYAAIRELGRDGIAELVERNCDQAQSLTLGIGRLQGAEVIWPRAGKSAPLNQGLVRFLDPRPSASESDHHRYTDRVIEMTRSLGVAFFTGTVFREKRCMRISVCNWQTSDEDIRRSIETVGVALNRLKSQD